MQKYKLSSHATIILGIIVALVIVAFVIMQLQSGSSGVENYSPGAAGQMVDTLQDDANSFE